MMLAASRAIWWHMRRNHRQVNAWVRWIVSTKNIFFLCYLRGKSQVGHLSLPSAVDDARRLMAKDALLVALCVGAVAEYKF